MSTTVAIRPASAISATANYNYIYRWTTRTPNSTAANLYWGKRNTDGSREPGTGMMKSLSEWGNKRGRARERKFLPVDEEALRNGTFTWSSMGHWIWRRRRYWAWLDTGSHMPRLPDAAAGLPGCKFQHANAPSAFLSAGCLFLKHSAGGAVASLSLLYRRREQLPALRSFLTQCH